jgi:hypothetical protein
LTGFAARTSASVMTSRRTAGLPLRAFLQRIRYERAEHTTFGGRAELPGGEEDAVVGVSLARTPRLPSRFLLPLTPLRAPTSFPTEDRRYLRGNGSAERTGLGSAP